MTARPKPPHPWLFALAAVPYGVGGVFTGQIMPHFAEHAGFTLDNIGWFTTLLFVPTWLQFLYAPIIDLGMARRYWLILMAALGATCFAAASAVSIHDHTRLFLALAFAGQLLSGLVGSCCGALMATTIPDQLRGRAGAAYNVGNLAGGALVASLIMSLGDHDVPSTVIGASFYVLMLGPALAVFLIVEPTRIKPHRVFRTMARDVSGVLFTKSGITGILLCISPVGTAALANSFTGMTRDYHASSWVVSTINGIGQAVLASIGAWIGGVLCDRHSRRAMYLLSGALTAIVGIVVALSPRTELAYAIGVSTYYLVMGLCFAAFTATALETIGHGDAAASTKYTLFTAAGNVAIAYVNLIDTQAYGHWGQSTGALFATDSLLNLGGVAVLGVVFWRLGSLGARRHPPESSIDTAVPEPPELPVARIHDGSPRSGDV